ncbi:uncharacterized protein LOC125090559 [Lutra lutra]|uniref:uncharacterized protein LOC125090559 n=1 Tax=Lutra lutra TaxID=9657 RepID=UPI001FD5201F|nr:uncharacterized protein LOC125090559 [Lutra lutra]
MGPEDRAVPAPNSSTQFRVQLLPLSASCPCDLGSGPALGRDGPSPLAMRIWGFPSHLVSLEAPTWRFPVSPAVAGPSCGSQCSLSTVLGGKVPCLSLPPALGETQLEAPAAGSAGHREPSRNSRNANLPAVNVTPTEVGVLVARGAHVGLSPPLSPRHLPPNHASAPTPRSALRTDVPLRSERARGRTASAGPRGRSPRRPLPAQHEDASVPGDAASKPRGEVGLTAPRTDLQDEPDTPSASLTGAETPTGKRAEVGAAATGLLRVTGAAREP